MLELIGRLWRERKLSPGQESEQQKAQAEANRSSGNCRASELRSAADVASRILQNRTNKEYFRNTTLDLARALEEAPPIDLCDLRDVDGFLKSMVKQYLDALSKRDIETATNALKWITEVVFCRNALSTCPGETVAAETDRVKELARKACALLICYVNIHDCDINIAYLEQKEAEFVKAYNEKSDQAFQMRAMHPDAVKELKTYQVGQSTLSPVAQQIHDIETVRVQNWKNVLDIRRKLSFKQGERIKKKGLADSLVITLSQKDTTLPPDVEEVIDEICSENKAATLKTIEATEAADNRMGDYMKTTETIVNSPERCKKIIQVEMDAAAAPRKLNTLQEELENSQTDHRNLVVNQ